LAKLGANTIKTIEKSTCCLCGSTGLPIYANLPDRLFGASGLWNLKKCPDSACSLIWLDPMPASEDIGKAYIHYYTHAAPGKNSLLDSLKRALIDACLASTFNYPSINSPGQKAAGLLFTTPWLREKIARSVAWLPYKPGGRLLDVGCGSGAFLIKMRRLGWQVEGVEVDQTAVAQASRQGLEVHCCHLEEQNFPENAFDAVTLSHVIEHVHEPVKLLTECWRLLKKGGRLVVMTPNTASWGHKIFRENWRELDPPRHLHLFSPNSLRLLAEQAAIRTTFIRTHESQASGIFQTSRAIARHGITNPASRKSRTAKMEGVIFSLIEHWQLTHHPEIGEELILMGIK
jgi:2-polyprenyl-3-methyl-5-hydroxy-6-metoxy-1,4-benzoquinol methylase